MKAKNGTRRIIAIVGPAHPFSGGIAQHTSRLALELELRGHQVLVESWSHQYPRFLYRGESKVPEREPEIGIPSSLRSELKWFSPMSWLRAGRRLASAEIVVINVPTPFHVVPYRVMRFATKNTPRFVAILHNVLPHESGFFANMFARLISKIADVFVVHGPNSRTEAVRVGVPQRFIEELPLPSPWPNRQPGRNHLRKSPEHVEALFFGTVRPYKGLSLLIEAVGRVPGIGLTIAGKFWESPAPYLRQIETLNLSDRVTVVNDYISSQRFDTIFGDADFLVMPYVRGTGSIVSELAFSYGLPVISTSAGDISNSVDSGITGLVIPPGDLESLVEALRTASNRSSLLSWKTAIARRGQSNDESWDRYCSFLEGLSFQ